VIFRYNSALSIYRNGAIVQSTYEGRNEFLDDALFRRLNSEMDEAESAEAQARAEAKASIKDAVKARNWVRQKVKAEFNLKAFDKYRAARHLPAEERDEVEEQFRWMMTAGRQLSFAEELHVSDSRPEYDTETGEVLDWEPPSTAPLQSHDLSEEEIASIVASERQADSAPEPKRRGRRPGSKNRPKVPNGADASAE